LTTFNRALCAIVAHEQLTVVQWTLYNSIFIQYVKEQ